MAMAHPNLIQALRDTARRLDDGANFRWTHMGQCNCGHLTQTVTGMAAREIHQLALEKAGDWTEQAREYCPTSGYPMDHILATLLDLGLTQEDLAHLERLDDARVLRRLPIGQRYLNHRRREDAVRYMRLWSDLLEEEWLVGQQIPETLKGSLETFGSEDKVPRPVEALVSSS